MTQEFKNGDVLVHCHFKDHVRFIGKIDQNTSAVWNGATLQCVYTTNLSYPKKERWINIMIANDPNGAEFPQFDLFESEAAAIAGAVKLHNYRRVATKKIEY